MEPEFTYFITKEIFRFTILWQSPTKKNFQVRYMLAKPFPKAREKAEWDLKHLLELFCSGDLWNTKNQSRRRKIWTLRIFIAAIWIPLGESLLIEISRPLWNYALDGFGNHDPGNGRYNQQKSPWDTLHPGREWAEKLQIGKSLAELQRIVKNFLDK